MEPHGNGLATRNISNKKKPMKSVPANKNNACPKCGYKTRHERNCPLKKKGEEDDEVSRCSIQMHSTNRYIGTRF